jgi:hypothetical protein
MKHLKTYENIIEDVLKIGDFVITSDDTWDKLIITLKITLKFI